jgi:hypothetical protein
MAGGLFRVRTEKIIFLPVEFCHCLLCHGGYLRPWIGRREQIACEIKVCRKKNLKEE